MKSATQLRASTGNRETWIPLIEVAAREVFELMLGCQLTLSAKAEETTLDVTARGGIDGPTVRRPQRYL